jgi:subtilisin family serine protease
MEVFKILVVAALASTLLACSQKTVENVDQTQVQASCGGLIYQNRFIVEWEDGHTTIEHSANYESFKSEFVQPNLVGIKRFYKDQDVQLLQNESESLEGLSTASNFWGQEKVQADLLWNLGVKGKGVKVGVVDSFVQINHPQLATRIAYNNAEIPNNGIDDDGNGYIDDYAGVDFRDDIEGEESIHGTHVAGIVLADSTVASSVSGSPAMKGMAPEAELIAAPFINPSGSGSLSAAINALNYVAQRGADIINNSWGGTGCEGGRALQSTFASLDQKGILLTVASGNSTRDIGDSPEYPAAFNLPNQITVASSSFSDFMSSFSNSSNKLVHIAAPGEKIYSTIPFNKYSGALSGTSMATPFVSGAAALLKSAFPRATSQQIKEALLTTVDYSNQNQFRVSSRGRMNVYKAYLKLKSTFGP